MINRSFTTSRYIAAKRAAGKASRSFEPERALLQPAPASA